MFYSRMFLKRFCTAHLISMFLFRFLDRVPQECTYFDLTQVGGSPDEEESAKFEAMKKKKQILEISGRKLLLREAHLHYHYFRVL